MRQKPDSYQKGKTDLAPLTKTGITSEGSRSIPPTQNPKEVPGQSHKNTSGIGRCSTKSRPKDYLATPYGTTQSNSSQMHQRPYQEDSSHSHRKNTKKCISL